MSDAEPTIVDVKPYKKWQIEISELPIYKGKRKYKFVSYGYRFYSAGSLITSSGIHFLSQEIAFEAGKRKIDIMLKNKNLEKPNNQPKGESMGFGKKAQDQVEAKKSAEKGEKPKTNKRPVTEQDKKNDKTAGNSPSAKTKRAVPKSDAPEKTKPQTKPETKKPSGKGSDVVKPKQQKINQVNGEAKMSKAVNKATGAVERQVKAVAVLVDKSKTARDILNTLNGGYHFEADQGIALLQAYKVGITSVTLNGATEPTDTLKAIRNVPNKLASSGAAITRQEKAYSSSLEKVEEGNAKLDDLKAQLKEVVEAEKAE